MEWNSHLASAKATNNSSCRFLSPPILHTEDWLPDPSACHARGESKMSAWLSLTRVCTRDSYDLQEYARLTFDHITRGTTHVQYGGGIIGASVVHSIGQFGLGWSATLLTARDPIQQTDRKQLTVNARQRHRSWFSLKSWLALLLAALLTIWSLHFPVG